MIETIIFWFAVVYISIVFIRMVIFFWLAANGWSVATFHDSFCQRRTVWNRPSRSDLWERRVAVTLEGSILYPLRYEWRERRARTKES